MAKGGPQSHEDIEKGVHMNDHSGDEGVFLSDVEKKPRSSASDSEVAGVFESCRETCTFEVDMESGLPEIPVNNPTKDDKACRICHLSLEGTPGSGIPINLGCSCKQELAVAHKQCAETWFKSKGNKICEICGSLATNDVCVTETKVILDDQLTETASAALAAPTRRRRFWNAFVLPLYVQVIANLINWFLVEDLMPIIVSLVIVFSIVACEVVDRRRTGNPSTTQEEQLYACLVTVA